MWAALPRRGAVAQMGERCNRTAEVRGSIPLSSTSLFNDLAGPPGGCTEKVRKTACGHFRQMTRDALCLSNSRSRSA